MNHIFEEVWINIFRPNRNELSDLINLGVIKETDIKIHPKFDYYQTPSRVKNIELDLLGILKISENYFVKMHGNSLVISDS